MASFFKQNRIFIGVFIIISASILAIIYSTLNVYKPLPIYQPAMVNTALVDSTIQHKKKYHIIADFSFINQNGKTITQETYRNKIYVADFFFTTCQTICPIMTSHMAQIQNEIIADDDVLLLSHTVMPEIDTVEQLKRYAKKKDVIDGKWHLVTGSKNDIYNMARKSYLVAKENGNSFDMIHTENFVLIDKNRQIRGYYDGTSLEDINKLLEDIKILKKEYE